MKKKLKHPITDPLILSLERSLERFISSKRKTHPRGYLSYEELFKRTGDPLIPLEAFVWDYRHGQPIRNWVATWFGTLFEIYLSEGDPLDLRPGSLETLLGLYGKGKKSSLMKAEIRRRHLVLSEEIFTLNKIGVKIDSAIDAVIAMHRLKAAQSKYLRRKYFSCKQKNPEVFEDVLRDISKWSQRRKEKFRKQYPLLNSGFKVT